MGLGKFLCDCLDEGGFEGPTLCLGIKDISSIVIKCWLPAGIFSYLITMALAMPPVMFILHDFSCLAKVVLRLEVVAFLAAFILGSCLLASIHRIAWDRWRVRQMRHDIFWAEVFVDLKREVKSFEKRSLFLGEERFKAMVSLSKAHYTATWSVANYSRCVRKLERRRLHYTHTSTTHDSFDDLVKVFQENGRMYCQELADILEIWGKSLASTSAEVNRIPDGEYRKQIIDLFCLEWRIIINRLLDMRIQNIITEERRHATTEAITAATIHVVPDTSLYLDETVDVEDARELEAGGVWEELSICGWVIERTSLNLIEPNDDHSDTMEMTPSRASVEGMQKF